jgi:hypothetical protein
MYMEERVWVSTSAFRSNRVIDSCELPHMTPGSQTQGFLPELYVLNR